MIKINLVSFLKTSVCFLLFLTFGSVYSIFFPYELEILIAGFTVILMLFNKACKLDMKLLKVLLFTFVILFISIIFTHSSFSDYKILFVRSILVLLFVTAFKNDYDEIKQAIIKVLWIIVVLALLNFLLTMIFPMLFSLKQFESGYQVYSINYIFNMLTDHSILGFNLIRNQSIFWEPGILQICMNILIYYILLERKKSLLKASLPIFILITTVSTTGFLILIFILFVRFKNNFSLKGRGALQTLGLLLIVLIFIPVVYNEVVHKFQGEAKASSTLRMFDFYRGMTIAINNPIVGIGMNHNRLLEMTGNDSIEIEGKIIQVERGNTNSFILMLTKLGFPITILLLFALYKQKIFYYKPVFFTIILLSLASEPLYASYPIILLLISSIKLSSSSK